MSRSDRPRPCSMPLIPSNQRFSALVDAGPTGANKRIHNSVNELPTVPNVDSQESCSGDSTTAKIFASVEPATLDSCQKTNPESNSGPVQPEADLSYVPSRSQRCLQSKYFHNTKSREACVRISDTTVAVKPLT